MICCDVIFIEVCETLNARRYLGVKKDFNILSDYGYSSLIVYENSTSGHFL